MSNPIERSGILTHDQNTLPTNQEYSKEESDPLSRVLVTVATTIGMYIAQSSVGVSAEANAATGGYPDADKPCVAQNDSDYGRSQGVGYWCDGYRWGDRATGAENSSRGYGYRNCTDWVAFRMPQLVHKPVPWGWGNANEWDNKAAAAGYAVDTIPEPGDVAVWNTRSYGHVEVVESVNGDGSANTSGYNKHRDGNYSWQANVRADVYIDLNGTGRGIGGAPVGSEAPSVPYYESKRVAVVPNVLGGVSLFAAANNGLLAYKDQLTPGGDLRVRPWGTITTSTRAHPEVVRYPNGALSVFARGVDDRLYHAWQYGPGTVWSEDLQLGTVTLGGEPSSVLNPTGGVSVFFPDANGNMRTIDQIGQGGDISGMPIHNLGGNVKGKPAIINIGGKMAIFAQGIDYRLKTNFQLAPGGTWSGWLELGYGQKIKGDPAAVINRLGGMTVMAIGEHGDIVGIDQTAPGGDMNKPFFSLGKPSGIDLSYSPAIAQTHNGEQMVFAADKNGMLYHKGQVHSSGYAWSNYFHFGGNLAGTPTAVRNALGGVSIFGRNRDGSVATLDQPGYGHAFNLAWINIGFP